MLSHAMRVITTGLLLWCAMILPSCGAYDMFQRLQVAPYRDKYVLLDLRRDNATGNVTNYTVLPVGIANSSMGDVTAALLRPWYNGWDVIKLTASPALLSTNASAAHFEVGFLEGYLTYEAMYNGYLNDKFDSIRVAVEPPDTPCMTQWIDEQIAFTKNLSARDTVTPFGKQLSNLLALIDGIWQGYTAGLRDALGKNPAAAITAKPLTWREVYLLSFDIERQDLKEYCTSAPLPARGLKPTHCSVLFKRTPTGEVIFGHNTWGSYTSMRRMYKTYEFDTTVAMSSYPGVITSVDDFIMTSRHLAITETTLTCAGNRTRSFASPQSIATFLRAMIASFTAASPSEWIQLFSQYNSGTYNNQWMLLNASAAMDAAQSGAKLPPGSFVVAESIPGTVISADQTDRLNKESYWASYNVPFYEASNRLCDNASASTPRGALLKAHQAHVGTLADMFEFLRYNRFLTDPASRGKEGCEVQGINAIAARMDLVAPNQTSDDCVPDPIAYGSIDVKLTSTSLWIQYGEFATIVLNGPTNDDLPSFSFSTIERARNVSVPHFGLPDVFDFSPILVNSDGYYVWRDRVVFALAMIAAFVGFCIVAAWCVVYARPKTPSAEAKYTAVP